MKHFAKNKYWLSLIVWLLLFISAHAGERLHSVVIENPRSYGYHAGDSTTQILHIKYAADMELRMDGAPKPGNVTPWIKLENLDVNTTEQDGGKYTRITLTYQISGFDPEKHNIETPDFTLTVEKDREKIPVVIHPVELHISRLSADIGDRALEEIKLAAPLGPDIVLSQFYTYLKWLSLLSGLILIAWAVFKIISASATWSTDYPFSTAFKRIRHMRSEESGSDLEARRVLHGAFNQQYGRTLFESDLDQFFNKNPTFQKEESVIRDFFGESRSLFFAKQAVDHSGHEKEAISRLSDLARRCRSLEKGTGS